MSEKVLTILLGSPRKDGNTEQLAGALSRGAKEAGYETRAVRLARMKLNGCIDCRKCWTSGAACVQRDDMAAVHENIKDASAVAFASPLYFYSWSSQIKPVWDRLLPFYAKNSPVDVRGKKAILLSAAGDAEDEVFEGLKASFRLACGYAKWEISGAVCAAGMYPKSDMAEKGQKYLALAYELGKKL